MIVVLAQNHEYLQAQDRRQKQVEARRYARWKEISRWGRLVNTWCGVSLFASFFFAIGTFVGINALPDGVVCRGTHSLCALLRVRQGKRIIPAKPFSFPFRLSSSNSPHAST